MTADDYDHAVSIARRACYGWTLTSEDWEDVVQEAALRAWRTPDHPSTAAWWGAREAAERILRTRRKNPLTFVPLERDKRAPVDVEADVLAQLTVDRLLARLPAREREAISLIDVEDRPWAEVEQAMGRPDGTIGGWRRRGLATLRAL